MQGGEKSRAISLEESVNIFVGDNMSLVNWYRVVRDETEQYEKEWIVEIEEKFGAKPLILATYVATPDVREHACSATPLTGLMGVSIQLGNYDDFSEEEAEELEEILRSGVPDHIYLKWRDVWSSYISEGWVAGNIIIRSGCEHLGKASFDDITFQDAYEMSTWNYDFGGGR